MTPAPASEPHNRHFACEPYELFCFHWPFIVTMNDLTHGVIEAITPFLDRPYVVFGHSFGAVSGFEAIRELRRRGLNQPFLFISAGRRIDI